MVLTKAKKMEILLYVIENIFEEDKDSELHKIMSHNKSKSVLDTLTMDDSAMMMLQYHDDQKAPVNITKGDAGLLRSFKAWIAYLNKTKQVEDNDWLNLTLGAFDKFHAS